VKLIEKQKITNCQVGNPNFRSIPSTTQLKLIMTLELLKERLRLCHVINPWERENTNYAKRKTKLGN
jgi:hypothetical protein